LVSSIVMSGHAANATQFRLVYLTGLISAPCKACAEWRDEDRLTVFFRKYFKYLI
jgi:hypothetical protein